MADRTIRAAGGVLWREQDGQLLVALVHRPKYDDWSLPKGKLEPGEPDVVGAVREVCEETGFAVTAGRSLGSSSYRVLDSGRDVAKTVRWWSMRATAGAFVPNAEVDELRWLPLARARAVAVDGLDGGPLAEFAAAPAHGTTVLLVRHGRAGSRQEWSGEDAERPLDERGREQAAALAHVLPSYGVQRVLSAPPLRCRSTVQPLADALGLSVEPCPAAAEDADPEGLADLVRELARHGTPTVVCSQGGVLPAAVSALTGRAAVPAPKGSAWALSLADDAVVDADHLPPLA